MKLEKIREAIGLLNSMVYCGEEHTKESEEIVAAGWKELLGAEQKIELLSKPVYRNIWDYNPYE